MPRPIPVPIVLHVDPEPFVDSLRRLYQDEFCHSVVHATLVLVKRLSVGLLLFFELDVE